MFRKVVTVLTNYRLLNEKSKAFPDFTSWSEQDKKDLRDLYETFEVLQGYGLAAPQIGIQKRAVTVNLHALGIDDRTNVVMVNPTLEVWGEDQRNEEACFSVPHVSSKVTRPSCCRVRFTNLEGTLEEIELEGFPAACLQHEVDHLDGTLYIDRVGRVYRGMLLKKCRKIEKRRIEAERAAKEEFERDHGEFFGDSRKTKKTHSRKRKPKPRKKRPNRSKKR